MLACRIGNVFSRSLDSLGSLGGRGSGSINRIERISRIVTASALRLGDEFAGALDLGEVHFRIVRTIEPVKSPVTSIPEPLRGQLATIRPAINSALCSAGERISKLSQAAILELANPAPRDEEVELVCARVCACVCGLHDHRFAYRWAGGEHEPGVWYVSHGHCLFPSRCQASFLGITTSGEKHTCNMHNTKPTR